MESLMMIIRLSKNFSRTFRSFVEIAKGRKEREETRIRMKKIHK
jgi:hypothetical protein